MGSIFEGGQYRGSILSGLSGFGDALQDAAAAAVKALPNLQVPPIQFPGGVQIPGFTTGAPTIPGFPNFTLPAVLTSPTVEGLPLPFAALLGPGKQVPPWAPWAHALSFNPNVAQRIPLRGVFAKKALSAFGCAGRCR